MQKHVLDDGVSAPAVLDNLVEIGAQSARQLRGVRLLIGFHSA